MSKPNINIVRVTVHLPVKQGTFQDFEYITDSDDEESDDEDGHQLTKKIYNHKEPAIKEILM